MATKRKKYLIRCLEVLACGWLAAAGTVARADDLKAKLKTSLGDVEIALHADKAPKTVSNFVELARARFFDGTLFHRVMPGFAVQTGDPTGTGGGGPGYCFADEFADGLAHDKPGTVSMVNTGPGSNGSQFLITLVAAPVLDRRNAVFGEVTAGLDVVQRIASVPLDGTRPAQDVRLESVEITGDLTPTPPAKTPELSIAELQVKARPELAKILSGLGASMRLGDLKDFSVDEARSRCAESQLAVTANFAKKAGARLHVYGRSDGKIYEVEQLQWTR